MRLFFYIGILSAALCLFRAASSEAAFYRYLDKEGVEHITNDLSQIPEEYREQFLSKGGPVNRKADVNAGEETGLPATRGVGRQEGTGDDKGQSPATLLERLIPFADRHSARAAVQLTIAVVAIVAIFIVCGRLGESFGHKRLAILIGLGLTAFIVVYLLSTHLHGINDNYMQVKGKIDRLQTKLSQRQEQLSRGNAEVEREKNDSIEEQKKLIKAAGQ